MTDHRPRLRIWTDRLRSRPRLALRLSSLPVLGGYPGGARFAGRGRMDDYTRRGTEPVRTRPFRRVRRRAGVATSRTRHPEARRLAQGLYVLARRHGKKLVVFFNSDSDETLELDPQTTVVFRTSFYRSRRAANEFALPGWSKDYVCCADRLVPRQKRARPVVGYCGYAADWRMSLVDAAKSVCGKEPCPGTTTSVA